MKISSCCWRFTRLTFTLSFLIIVHFSIAQESASTEIPTDEATINAGQTLFSNNCKVCHSVHEQVVGPALKEVYIRRPLPWIESFVKNSQKVIQDGDEYAQNLYKQFNNTVMPSFDFSNEEITSIMAYIKSETEKGPATAQAAPTATGGEQAVATGSTISSGFITAILIALIVVLVLILIVLGILISVITKYIKQKGGLEDSEREVVEQRFNFVKFVKSPGVIWLATFIFTAIVLKAVIDGLYTVGVQTGYAPTQPIAFSHKLHAGDNGIDCNYCHTGVRKSKNANIPSPNICLNCHSPQGGIVKLTGATEPSVEIKKIHTAVEKNEPIQWVRVHNLPDLVYFNHSQHVEVGGIECQTCHGPVETMEVVQQVTPLTMGWCIDCHRKTELNTKGNEYYDKLVELHNEKSKEPFVVENNGGLECARCHY